MSRWALLTQWPCLISAPPWGLVEDPDPSGVGKETCLSSSHECYMRWPAFSGGFVSSVDDSHRFLAKCQSSSLGSLTQCWFGRVLHLEAQNLWISLHGDAHPKGEEYKSATSTGPWAITLFSSFMGQNVLPASSGLRWNLTVHSTSDCDSKFGSCSYPYSFSRRGAYSWARYPSFSSSWCGESQLGS